METNTINLKQFIPNQVVCGKHKKLFPLQVNEDDRYFLMRYETLTHNGGKRKYGADIPKTVSRSKDTFEVLGLLQAEMGKTQIYMLMK